MEKDDEKRISLEADGIFGKELNKQDSGAMRLEQLLDARSYLELRLALSANGSQTIQMATISLHFKDSLKTSHVKIKYSHRINKTRKSKKI